MDASHQHVRRKGGRRLSFDRSAALRQAMLLFWQHGYEGTSLAALTAALGVTPPSIYTAFGDKKRLFLEAVALYLSSDPSFEQIVDQAPNVRAAISQLLARAAAGFTGEDTPTGCLLATSAITGSAESADIQAALAKIRRDIEEHLQRLIVRGVEAGELPASTNVAALAGLVMAVIQGMSTLARDGASREHILEIAEAAMTCWPLRQTATHSWPRPASDP